MKSGKLTAISLLYLSALLFNVSIMGKVILRNKKVFGVGVNDFQGCTCDSSGRINRPYRDWYNMLSRCYCKIKNAPTYNDCTVCDEWLYSSNFIKWHNEHYIEGFQLDKDILIKGNKVYSPATCAFVPQEINSLFTKHNATRGKYPIGVYKNSRGKGYDAKVWMPKGCVNKRFDTIEEAFNAYKESKEAYIKIIADKYKGVISDEIYNAMYKYQVEITD